MSQLGSEYDVLDGRFSCEQDGRHLSLLIDVFSCKVERHRSVGRIKKAHK